MSDKPTCRVCGVEVENWQDRLCERCDNDVCAICEAVSELGQFSDQSLLAFGEALLSAMRERFVEKEDAE